MLLQRLPLSLLRQRDVARGRLQAGMTQRLLDGLEIRAASDVMGGHGVPQGMRRSILDAGRLHVLAHCVLNIMDGEI